MTFLLTTLYHRLSAVITLTAFFLVLPAQAASLLSTPEFEIKVTKPTFVLPQFTGPYQEREASISPSEYETAERLRTLLDEGQRDKVLAELDTFYSIELSPAMLMLKAQIYFSMEMYTEAEETYQGVLKRMPQLVRAHSDLGQLYLVKEDYPNARKHFAQAVALGSNEAMIHGQLGYLNLMLYGPHSAISSYQRASSIEPDNRQWQQGLLAALTQAEMYEAAQALIREMISLDKTNASLWLNQTALALHREDYRQALTSLEMAMTLGDKDLRNIKTAAQLHLQLGSYDRALVLLDQILMQSKLDMTSINEYFVWLTQLGMWDKAQKMLEAAARNINQLSRDDQSQYYLLSARISEQKNQIAKAENHYRQALDLNPTNGNGLLAFAAFSARQKNYVVAELLYIRAEAVAGMEQKALMGRSQLYIDMQDYPAALNQMKSTLQKFPDMLELKNNIEILENIIRAKETT